MNKARRVLTLNPFWCVVLPGTVAAIGLVVWLVWWVFWVPPDHELLWSCPRREKIVAQYEAVEASRPLRGYEVRRWQENLDYVNRWCK